MKYKEIKKLFKKAIAIRDMQHNISVQLTRQHNLSLIIITMIYYSSDQKMYMLSDYYTLKELRKLRYPEQVIQQIIDNIIEKMRKAMKEKA